MDLHHHFFNGVNRPGWAGPVTAETRKRRRNGSTQQSVELAGVVLPVNVHPRYLPAGSLDRHTFGLGLGFPDLSESLLDPDLREGMSRQWSGIEQKIGAASAQLMGWGGKSDPRTANLSALPDFALHLMLKGTLPNADPDKARDPLDPSEIVSGEVSKVFPIRDPSGSKHRMQRVGSPLAFTVSPFNSTLSRDPASL
jgi:hypothetical protein